MQPYYKTNILQTTLQYEGLSRKTLYFYLAKKRKRKKFPRNKTQQKLTGQ